MKSKYLITALIAGSLGSGVALAETDPSLGMSNNADTAGTSSSAYGDHKSRQEVQSEAARDLRANGAGTGEGYTAEQMREARGNPGSTADYPASQKWGEPEPTSINSGTVSIGDGTAKP